MKHLAELAGKRGCCSRGMCVHRQAKALLEEMERIRKGKLTYLRLWRQTKETLVAQEQVALEAIGECEALCAIARNIENPCDSCKGVCESERETVKCSAAKAYDELQAAVKRLCG